MTEEKSKELTAKWKARMAGTVLDIQKIETTYTQGHHPFMVGNKHVVYASDHCGGMLTTAAIDSSGKGCYMPESRHSARHCDKRFDDPVHKGDVACFLVMTRPCTQREVTEVLFPLKEEMAADGIEGFAFTNHTQITDWGKKE